MTLLPETRLVETADGRTLSVSEYGDPAGTPLFCLHGMPGSRFQRYWSDGIEKRFGFRTIMFDRPGYGGSTRKPGRIVADGARDIAAVADALGIDRFAVLGLSGGGPYALAAAALLDERVTICGTTVAPAPREADIDWYAGMGNDSRTRFRAVESGEDAAVAYWEARARTLVNESEERNGPSAASVRRMNPQQLAFAEARRRAGVEPFANGVGGIVDDDLATIKPWGFSLASIRRPVRVWAGSGDVDVPPAHCKWVAEQTPGAALAMLDGDHVIALAVHYEEYFVGLRAGAP